MRQIFEKLEKFKLEWKKSLWLTQYGESEKAIRIRLANFLLQIHLPFVFWKWLCILAYSVLYYAEKQCCFWQINVLSSQEFHNALKHNIFPLQIQKEIHIDFYIWRMKLRVNEQEKDSVFTYLYPFVITVMNHLMKRLKDLKKAIHICRTFEPRYLMTGETYSQMWMLIFIVKKKRERD